MQNMDVSIDLKSGISKTTTVYNSYTFTMPCANATIINVFVAETYQNLRSRTLPRRRCFYFQSHRCRHHRRKETFLHNLHPEKQENRSTLTL